MRQVVFLVECYKGDAVFLERPNAEEYVSKYGGIITEMSRHSHVKETPNLCVDIRQEREAVSTRSEQLSKDPPIAEQSSKCCRPAGEAVSTCGDSSSCEGEGLEQSIQDSGNSL
jgi:hypothetical protein